MMRSLKSLLVAILVLGLALAIWRAFGGDVSGFFNLIGSLFYQAIEAVGNFFYNLIDAFTS